MNKNAITDNKALSRKIKIDGISINVNSIFNSKNKLSDILFSIANMKLKS